MHPDVPLVGLLVAIGAPTAPTLKPPFDAAEAEEMAAPKRGDPVLPGVGPGLHADVAHSTVVVVLVRLGRAAPIGHLYAGLN